MLPFSNHPFANPCPTSRFPTASPAFWARCKDIPKRPSTCWDTQLRRKRLRSAPGLRMREPPGNLHESGLVTYDRTAES